MKTRIFAILIFVLFCFIWGNSILPSKPSNQISNTVVNSVGGTITHNKEEAENAPTFFNSENVRKLAHLTEFAFLGAATTVFVMAKHGLLSHILLLGLSTAVIDETIQLFNDRTSSVKDIWIDMGGFIIGVLCIKFIKAIAKRITYHRLK